MIRLATISGSSWSPPALILVRDVKWEPWVVDTRENAETAVFGAATIQITTASNWREREIEYFIIGWILSLVKMLPCRLLRSLTVNLDSLPSLLIKQKLTVFVPVSYVASQEMCRMIVVDSFEWMLRLIINQGLLIWWVDKSVVANLSVVRWANVKVNTNHGTLQLKAYEYVRM